MLCSHHKREENRERERGGGERQNELLSGTDSRPSRPWCRACRSEHLADRRIERGVEQIQGQHRLEGTGSMARLLDVLGLPSVTWLEQERMRLKAQLRRQLPLIGLVLFITAFAMPELIAPKILETLRAGSSGANAFQATAFWLLLGGGLYLKPLLAMLVERFGSATSKQGGGDSSRYWGWLAGGALVAALGWFGVGLLESMSVPAMLWVTGGIGVCLALVSVVIGGLLVEQGQRMGATGRLGAMQAAAIFLARIAASRFATVGGSHALQVPVIVSGSLLIVCAVWGGWALFQLSAVTAEGKHRDEGDNPAESGMISPIAITNAKSSAEADATGTTLRMETATEQPTASRGVGHRASPTWTSIWTRWSPLRACRNVWGAGAISALVYIAPNFINLQQEQNQRLHFTLSQQSNLDFIGPGLSLIGIAAYLWLCRRLTLQTMLTVGIVCNAIGTLLYLGYNSILSAYMIEGTNGLLSALVFAMLFDLAIRAIPRGHAMAGYALLTGLIALCSHLSNLSSSWLALAGWGFNQVVWLSAGLSLSAIAVVALLPASLLDRREGKIVIEAPSERATGKAVPSFGTSR